MAIKYYTWTPCNPCRERSELYRKAHDYCRQRGRLDLGVEVLNTTAKYQEYVKNVKPLRKRQGIPFVWDDELKQEIIFDGAETQSRPGTVVSGEEQETQKPAVSRPRRKRTAKAQQPDA